MVLRIPYHRSYPKAEVVSADDIVISLHASHLTITLNSVELIPKSEEDELLGVKEKVRDACATIVKSAIQCIEFAYDSNAEAYDFSIMTHRDLFGYNCKTRAEAKAYYETLTNWWLQ